MLVWQLECIFDELDRTVIKQKGVEVYGQGFYWAIGQNRLRKKLVTNEQTVHMLDYHGPWTVMTPEEEGGAF